MSFASSPICLVFSEMVLNSFLARSTIARRSTSATEDWILFLSINRVFLSLPRGLSKTTRKVPGAGEEFDAVAEAQNTAKTPTRRLILGIESFIVENALDEADRVLIIDCRRNRLIQMYEKDTSISYSE